MNNYGFSLEILFADMLIVQPDRNRLTVTTILDGVWRAGPRPASRDIFCTAEIRRSAKADRREIGSTPRLKSAKP
jgi:hypothetical protein